MPPVHPADVDAAAARIAGHVHRTPVLTSASLDAACGAEVFLKCENLQRVGAFKIRGATNAVLSLDDATAAGGVAAHSSGNHGQALALAARERGVPAHVVMPSTAPAVKRAAVAGYGATIVDCGPSLAARQAAVAEVLTATGATEIHPYDDDRVIAGQGTACLELLQEVEDLDVVVAPVGGGGLISGTALAVAGHSPSTVVVGAEPAGADDAHRSLTSGTLVPCTSPETIADGLRASLSDRTFAVIRASVTEIVTVEESAIISAMRFMWERTKLVVEPSAAVAVGALLGGGVPGGRVGVILSGGNADIDHLPWVQGER